MKFRVPHQHDLRVGCHPVNDLDRCPDGWNDLALDEFRLGNLERLAITLDYLIRAIDVDLRFVPVGEGL
jgi:hypothetical protein